MRGFCRSGKKFTFVLLYKRTPPLSNSFILIFDRLQFSPSKWSRNGTIWKFRHSPARCQNGNVPITKEFSRIWFVKKCRDSRNQNTSYFLFQNSNQAQGAAAKCRKSVSKNRYLMWSLNLKSKSLLDVSFYDNVSFSKFYLFWFLSLKSRIFINVLFTVTISSNRVSLTYL